MRRPDVFPLVSGPCCIIRFHSASQKSDFVLVICEVPTSGEFILVSLAEFSWFYSAGQRKVKLCNEFYCFWVTSFLNEGFTTFFKFWSVKKWDQVLRDGREAELRRSSWTLRCRMRWGTRSFCATVNKQFGLIYVLLTLRLDCAGITAVILCRKAANG